MSDDLDPRETDASQGVHVPLARMVALAILLAATPVLALFALAGLELLGWHAAVIVSLVCLASAMLVARRGLHDIYGVKQFCERLARASDTGEIAAWQGARLFPELSDAAYHLRRAWVRERRHLQDRAVSAEAIFEDLPSSLILINQDRQISHATAGAVALLGEISLGRDLSSLLRNPEVLEAADRVLANGEAELVEFDGQFPAEKTLTAFFQRLPQSQMEGVRVVLSLSDVTQLKHIQQVRTDFVANVSHELKTPLAVVGACIETLQGKARDDFEARRRFTDMIATHVNRMVSLIEDLLSLSRIELNESMAPTEPVPLRELLSRVVEELEVPAQKRTIDIRLEWHSGPSTIPGDENEMSQVFRNLVENAVRYGRENSEVRLTTRFLPDNDAGPGETDPVGVEIEITDHGPGIPAHHIPRLTERFYRVDAARSREMGGTGLGLAIVKHVLNRHRGRLLIESVEGQGSSFAVQLPVSDNAVLPAQEPRPGRVIVT